MIGKHLTYVKKLITWFTKFSKIVAIVEYIYKGVLIAVDVVALTRDEILKIKPDFHYTDALNKTIDYLTKASEAIALVLEWIGGDKAKVIAAARAEAKAVAPGVEVTERDPVADLATVTGELDKIVQSNK